MPLPATCRRATTPDHPAHPVTQRHAVVIGAGLAGTAATRALTTAGWRVTLLDAQPGPALRASALPVGMLSPHVTRSPTPMSRLSALGVQDTRAYLHERIRPGSGWQDTQVDNLGHDPGCWPAAMVRPSALVSAWLADAQKTGRLTCHWSAPVGRIFRPADRPAGSSWHVLDRDGLELASSPVIVLAGAWGSARLLQESFGFDDKSLPLRPVKGQLSFGPWSGEPLAPRPRRDNGVFVPCYEDQEMPDGLPDRIWAMGSTYDRAIDDRLVSAQAHQKNLDSLRSLHPQAAEHMSQQLQTGELRGWADVRCASLDRLPLLGTLPDLTALRALMADAGVRRTRLSLEQCPRTDGIHVLTALGSRGITLAHSCGSWLQQHLDGQVMALPDDLRRALDPARFAWRQLRKQTAANTAAAIH